MVGERFFDDLFAHLLAENVKNAVGRGEKLSDACRASYGGKGGVDALRERIRGGDLPENMKREALQQLDIEEARALVANVSGPYRRI